MHIVKQVSWKDPLGFNCREIFQSENTVTFQHDHTVTVETNERLK